VIESTLVELVALWLDMSVPLELADVDVLLGSSCPS
jgi:hypothetical protein